MKLAAVVASCLILMAGAAPALARGAFLPTYHPEPCAGEACRGDDVRSGLPCTGLLCSFTSAKSLQRPVTASEAAAMQARAGAAAPAPAAVAAPAPAETPKKKRKIAARHPKVAKPSLDAKLDADPAR